MQDYREPAYCPECGTLGNRVLSAPAVRGDYAGYQCPVTGKWVEGRKAHEENLRQTGCRIFEPGEREEFQRRKEREEAEFDSKLEASIGETVAAMSQEKQQKLAQELAAGAGIGFTRSTVED
jgi:hypothetical protein